MTKGLTLTCVVATLILSACGGGGGGGGGGGTTTSYTAGGTLSGLAVGKSVILQNNGSSGLTLISDGSFTFASSLSDGAAYNVTVATQPSGQNCTVTNGTGTVSGADVTNIAVNCTADRFVVSGNNDGTLSVFRVNNMAGYATAMSYFDAGNGFAVQDMIYDAAHKRLVLITTNNIHVLSFDSDTGEVTAIDNRATSGNSSHLILNAAGSEAYVASGTSSGKVDAYTIGSTGTLSPVVSTTLTVDPDYIKLNPAGDHLYVVSRTDNSIVIFGVNSDNSLAASPTTVSTGSSPTSIGFNLSGTKAYLTLATNSDNFVTYDVAADGGLSNASPYTSSNNSVIDQVLSADGANLYTLDSSSNRSIDHYTIDAASGAATWVASTNISFNGNDLALSYLGNQLYVGHGSDALVSTFDVDPSDGSLTPVEWVRAFNNVNTVATVGGAGALDPTATYLLAPDQAGLERFSVATDGMLAPAATENSSGALIDGEVAVNYLHNLLLGAGEDTTGLDLLASYQFDPLSGTTSAADVKMPTVLTTFPDSHFERNDLGRSDRVMYVLDIVGGGTTNSGIVRTYAYAADGTITATEVDSDITGQGAENITLNPAGSYLYSLNSYGDTISYFKVGYSDGTLSQTGTKQPGLSGPGVGRPLDLKLHPNGRYAYVSLEDDDEIDTWTVDANGSLSSVTRLSTGTGTGPGPIAVHPNGKFVYNGERGTNDIVVYAVNTSNYTLSKQSVATAAAIPAWLTVDPQGKFLLARYNDESIQVFSIDQTSGALTAVQQVSAGSSGAGFMPTMTLVAPWR